MELDKQIKAFGLRNGETASTGIRDKTLCGSATYFWCHVAVEVYGRCHSKVKFTKWNCENWRF
jgi:hypothetical protein